MYLPFFASGHAMDKYLHGDRPFAFITGSSQGIGKALAVELASLDFNIVLHARTTEELDPVKEEVIKLYPDIEVVFLIQDASSVAIDWVTLLKPIRDLNVTVLINNVGGPSPIPWNTLEHATDEQIHSVLQVNINFPTLLTRNLLPTLMSHTPALILNITSMSTCIPPPCLSVYAGAKGYNLIFSQGLDNEMRLMKRAIDVKAVMTGDVHTDGYQRPLGPLVVSAKEFARSMLARANSSGPVYVGWWRHYVSMYGANLLTWLPASIRDPAIADATKKLLAWRESTGDETCIKASEIPS